MFFKPEPLGKHLLGQQWERRMDFIPLLPVDIFNIIFEQVFEHRNGLFSCLLVCKNWSIFIYQNYNKFQFFKSKFINDREKTDLEFDSIEKFEKWGDSTNWINMRNSKFFATKKEIAIYGNDSLWINALSKMTNLIRLSYYGDNAIIPAELRYLTKLEYLYYTINSRYYAHNTLKTNLAIDSSSLPISLKNLHYFNDNCGFSIYFGSKFHLLTNLQKLDINSRHPLELPCLLPKLTSLGGSFIPNQFCENLIEFDTRSNIGDISMLTNCTELEIRGLDNPTSISSLKKLKRLSLFSREPNGDHLSALISNIPKKDELEILGFYNNHNNILRINNIYQFNNLVRLTADIPLDLVDILPKTIEFLSSIIFENPTRHIDLHQLVLSKLPNINDLKIYINIDKIKRNVELYSYFVNSTFVFTTKIQYFQINVFLNTLKDISKFSDFNIEIGSLNIELSHVKEYYQNETVDIY